MSIKYVEQLAADDVADLLEQGHAVLVDTLPSDHFQARHIPGALNACVYEMAFLDTVAGIVQDKATRIILYGAGTKSRDCFAAADKLSRAGYETLAVFPGGLAAWREAGRALEGAATGVVDPPHPPLVIEGRKYALVVEDSVIHWTGRNNNGGHNGTLRFSGGELDGAGDLAASFVMDMKSIRNLNLEGDELKPVLEAHLHSDDFFFTAMFPQAQFSTSKIRLVEDGEATRPNAMMQGRLSLRGLENEIAFPAHIRNLDDGRITIMGNLDFDRTQWGVIYGASRFFQYLGMHVVFDFISIDFRLVLE